MIQPATPENLLKEAELFNEMFIALLTTTIKLDTDLCKATGQTPITELLCHMRSNAEIFQKRLQDHAANPNKG